MLLKSRWSSLSAVMHAGCTGEGSTWWLSREREVHAGCMGEGSTCWLHGRGKYMLVAWEREVHAGCIEEGSTCCYLLKSTCIGGQPEETCNETGDAEAHEIATQTVDFTARLNI